MARIELATSPLPRECSTTELHGQTDHHSVVVFTYFGAGEGNRTLVVSLEGFCSTIELHPLLLPLFLFSINARSLLTKPLFAQPSHFNCNLVEGEGFEPSKAEPSDLQSDPFDRSGTPPK
jgi:hypothetical protein